MPLDPPQRRPVRFFHHAISEDDSLWLTDEEVVLSAEWEAPHWHVVVMQSGPYQDHEGATV